MCSGIDVHRHRRLSWPWQDPPDARQVWYAWGTRNAWWAGKGKACVRIAALWESTTGRHSRKPTHVAQFLQIWCHAVGSSCESALLTRGLLLLRRVSRRALSVRRLRRRGARVKDSIGDIRPPIERLRCAWCRGSPRRPVLTSFHSSLPLSLVRGDRSGRLDRVS